MHQAIGITFALLGQLQTVFSPRELLLWQIPLCGSDRGLFCAQAKKVYKHMKARKDMNLASRQHQQLLHEVYYDGLVLTWLAKTRLPSCVMLHDMHTILDCIVVKR